MWCDVMCKKVCWKTNEWIRNEVLSHCSQVLDLIWLVWTCVDVLMLQRNSIYWLYLLFVWYNDWWMDRLIETKSKMRSLFSSQAQASKHRLCLSLLFSMRRVACYYCGRLGGGTCFRRREGQQDKKGRISYSHSFLSFRYDLGTLCKI